VNDQDLESRASLGHDQDAPQRRKYSEPKLKLYGSVRELTAGGGGSGGDGTVMDMTTSDRALKENIVRVGTHPAGYGLYLFDYRSEFQDAFGHGRQFGVMADEVEKIVPEAVHLAADGYRRVDYGAIGVLRH
jgi:hypothetical protein